MRIAVYVGGGILALFLLFCLLVFIEIKRQNGRNERHVLRFIVRNPAKASLYIIENGVTVADLQSDVRRPLASTVKIIILAEFADQVADERMDPNEVVAMSSLNRFYIPNSDGGAHTAWLFDLKEKGIDTENGVTMAEVARGMIKFSSNANTEFLMDVLGLDAINRKLKHWGLHEHDDVYPFSSAVLMPTYIKDTLGVSLRQAASIMKSFSDAEYAAKSLEIFHLLRNDPEGKWLRRLNRRERSKWKFQRIWSDRLVRSTAREYAHLMKDLFEGDKLNGKAQEVFQDLIRLQVSNPNVAYAAQKGGSSLNILTVAMYYEDLAGNKSEMAFFVHDGAIGGEQMWLEKKLVPFINHYFTNEQFKRQVIEACQPGSRK